MGRGQAKGSQMRPIPTAISALTGLERMQPNNEISIPVRGPNIALTMIKEEEKPPLVTK